MTSETIPVKEAWEDYVGTHPNSFKYPKRLIEVDLPIARISAHSRREKSIRHGHISTLHIWWARRPLAACRAVICASLWPDPADPLCPPAFREAAVKHIKAFAARAASSSLPRDQRPKLSAEQVDLERGLSPESRSRWETIAAGALTLDVNKQTDMAMLRLCLLDFIADFANWDNSTVPAYLETSRGLTQAAHEALGGIPGTRPLVVDPFAGGGSIPLEALRVGADAFASDLNPVPILLNRVMLSYVPKYGHALADAVRKWGDWVTEKAEARLAPFYPRDSEDAKPIAYLWARTVLSEAPGQGKPPVEVPLLRSMWLAKNSNNDRALRWVRDKSGVIVVDTLEVEFADGNELVVRRPKLEIFSPITDGEVIGGTVARGSVTCPITGYTTPVASVRSQLKPRRGGASDARLLAVRYTCPERQIRSYRLPNEHDFSSVIAAENELAKIEHLLDIPSEPTPLGGGRGAGRAFSQRNYGMDSFRDLFTPRQLLSISTIAGFIREAAIEIEKETESGLAKAVQSCLALSLGRLTDFSSSLCTLNVTGNRGVFHTFARQAIPIVWDFMETNPLNDVGANWQGGVDTVFDTVSSHAVIKQVGDVQQQSATNHSLPGDSVSAFITDPPYYDAVPYSDLSDYFYVWLKRVLPDDPLFKEALTPKEDECIVDDAKGKDEKYFEQEMTKAMSEGRRILMPSGIGVVVFANKTTDGWEALLQAMIDAGWIITGSWPIDTERGGRLRAMNSAALASSVHLICRPREDQDGSLVKSVGEWRDVLAQLPKRIHEWMPRLTTEGVVGADAIFACLGPALEIFSKYSRVEKSNGDAATLREYLEHVWAAVSTEALALIFKDADASGLEPDARLTAMWMWTLGGGKDDGGGANNAAGRQTDEDDGDDNDVGSTGKLKASGGYALEFDAARKIAQGLGIRLEQCTSLVEIKGDQARLLPVGARTRHLFGSDAARNSGRGPSKLKQRTLFDDLNDAESADAGWTQLKGPPPGSTTLDRVHQAMILFAANRGELLKRFLVDDGVGKESRFWKLADNLNKLYPTGTEERRWVEGVLARKRGLGL